MVTVEIFWHQSYSHFLVQVWYSKYMPSARNYPGFTLIELMVVIAIIAILATIGFAVYRNAQVTARDGKRVADIQEIQKALEQYYAVNGSFSTNLTAIGANSIGSYFQNSQAPCDPGQSSCTAGAGYTYRSCSIETPPKHYIVCASLEGSKGNANAIPADGCSGYTQSSGTTYYCVSNLSN